MKLSSFLNQRCDLAVPFGGEMLNMVYKPGVLTPQFESDVRKAASDDDSDFLSGKLSPLLDSWDLFDDAGVAVPTDVPSLRQLPIAILSGCLLAIAEDFRPNPKASGSTAAG